MIDSNVARRYARALLALAGSETAPLQRYAEQLTQVAHGFEENPAAALLLSPGASKAAQLGMVEALAGKLDKPVADLLRLLVERNRFDGLVQIAESFSALVDARLGQVRATVTSAAPLDGAEVAAISAQLARATGKQISVDVQVDPALIGGIQADVGGMLYDGSLRTQLEKLRAELKAKAA